VTWLATERGEPVALKPGDSVWGTDDDKISISIYLYSLKRR